MIAHKPGRTQRLVIFGVFFAVFFTAMGLVVHRASAIPAPCIQNPDGSCWYGPAKSAKKFRKGYFTKSAGFPAAQVWKNPKKAKVAWVAKIDAYILANPNVYAVLSQHFYPTNTKKDPACTDYCLAYKTYGELMNGANCVGWAYPSTDGSTCTYPQSRPLTVKDIQRGGALVLCGTSVVIGVAAAVGSDGIASPAVVGILGGTGCGWGFWASFS